jgi:hypothetical protein
MFQVENKQGEIKKHRKRKGSCKHRPRNGEKSNTQEFGANSIKERSVAYGL